MENKPNMSNTAIAFLAGGIFAWIAISLLSGRNTKPLEDQLQDAINQERWGDVEKINSHLQQQNPDFKTLKNMLKKAIEAEDYTLCCTLRDEIKRRKEQKKETAKTK